MLTVISDGLVLCVCFWLFAPKTLLWFNENQVNAPSPSVGRLPKATLLSTSSIELIEALTNANRRVLPLQRDTQCKLHTSTIHNNSLFVYTRCISRLSCNLMLPVAIYVAGEPALVKRDCSLDRSVFFCISSHVSREGRVSLPNLSAASQKSIPYWNNGAEGVLDRYWKL